MEKIFRGEIFNKISQKTPKQKPIFKKYFRFITSTVLIQLCLQSSNSNFCIVLNQSSLDIFNISKLDNILYYG